MNHTQPRGLQFALQWALESASDPATAAADWLARDIRATAYSAEDLLTSADVTLKELKQAKDAFKTMRVLGETKADRRTGGRLYLASIAAAIVVHDTRISRQSDEAIVRALRDMSEDDHVSLTLRRLAVQALAKVKMSDTDMLAGANASAGSGSFDRDEDDEVDESLPLEIERTYLLDRLPRLPMNANAIRIEQGYLPENTKLQGRLRREIRSDGTIRHTHAIKRGSGLIRSEVQREISLEEFEKHWPATSGQRLVKTRYLVQSGDFVWEIDVFDELKLVLAEVELPTATTIATPPSWLAPHIVREVTHEKQFRNYQLAQRLAREAM